METMEEAYLYEPRNEDKQRDLYTRYIANNGSLGYLYEPRNEEAFYAVFNHVFLY